MIRFIITLGVFLFIAACNTAVQTQQAFEDKAEIIKKTNIPDSRLDVFEAQLEHGEEGWKLSGAVTQARLKNQLEQIADSLLGRADYDNNLQLLPQAELGDSIYAVTKVSVTPLRRSPRHGAEMVDQTIMGRELKLLQKRRGWYRAQTHYGYVGWINGSAIWRVDSMGLESWRNTPKVRVAGLSGFVHSDALEESIPVSDVVLNMFLKKVDSGRLWTMVETPDGRTGYIRTSQVEPYSQYEAARRNAVLQTAKSMMGLPYLWGGNSSKGNDCSGFTQTVFFNHGIQLPRDANQQAEVGKTIVPDSTFSNVLPGDLIFFGYNGRITHVGISLGGPDFIDQGGRVAINSLDEDSPNFNAYRKRTFVTIKRIINPDA